MAVKKKKIDYTIWVLGAAAVGLLGYVFREDITNIFKKKEPEPDPEPIPGPIPTPIPTPIITNGGIITTSGGVTTGLSGMGTPKDRLNFNQNLKKGDKGQEVAKLQQILNRIAKITGSIQITQDGIFGSGTEARLNKVTGKDKINLYKAYLILFAIWNAKNNKDVKNWYKNYYQYYLTQPDRLKNARTYYFAKNSLI